MTNMKNELAPNPQHPEDDGDPSVELETEAPAHVSAQSTRPYLPSLLENQLINTVGGYYGFDYKKKLEKGTLRLYEELAPSNVTESIVARHIVGLNNVTMECIGKFALSGKNVPLLRQALKASELTREMIKFYQNLKKGSN